MFEARRDSADKPRRYFPIAFANRRRHCPKGPGSVHRCTSHIFRLKHFDISRPTCIFMWVGYLRL